MPFPSKPHRCYFMMVLLLCSCTRLLKSPDTLPSKPAIIIAAQRANALIFFERLVGHWEGTGITKEGPIRDSAVWEWTLDHRFLRVTYVANAGDLFRAEGYLWHNLATDRVEFFEFNNGKWPVRTFTGIAGSDGNELRLEEHTPDRKISLVIRFVSEGSWEFEESDIQSSSRPMEPFAKVLFRRHESK